MEDEVIEQIEQPDIESEAPDYSWVPKKFLKDGEPDLQALSRSYQALEKRLGSRSLAPESVDDYVFESKNGYTYDADLSNSFKQEALEAGLSAEQYAFIMNKYEESIAQSQPSADQAAEVLKASWGRNFDNNLQAARRAWDEFAPSDADIDEVGNNPVVLKILARIGMELGEDKPTAKGASRPSAMTEEQINELIRKKDYKHDLKAQEVVRKWYEAKFRD